MNPLTIPSGCNNFTHLDGIFANGTLTLFLAEDRWLVAFMRALEVWYVGLGDGESVEPQSASHPGQFLFGQSILGSFILVNAEGLLYELIIV